jgi:hypothetical protein
MTRPFAVLRDLILLAAYYSLRPVWVWLKGNYERR